MTGRNSDPGLRELHPNISLLAQASPGAFLVSTTSQCSLTLLPSFSPCRSIQRRLSLQLPILHRLPPVHWRAWTPTLMSSPSSALPTPSQTCATLFPRLWSRACEVGRPGSQGLPGQNHTEQKQLLQEALSALAVEKLSATAGLVGLLRWHAVHRMGTQHLTSRLICEVLFFHKEEEWK